MSGGGEAAAAGAVSALRAPSAVAVGMALSTTGRWGWVEELLESAQASHHPVTAVAIANQSGSAPPASVTGHAGVEVVSSSGGASAGRNAALRALGSSAEVISLPNDHSRLVPDTLDRVVARLVAPDPPAAVIGTLVEPGGVRFALPPAGTALNRWTVWRAIEPAMFVTPAVAALEFREAIGTGSRSPWQAGEGTDLLLRALDLGLRVEAAPDAVVLGRGEQRSLSRRERRVKLRSYARGTGYVLRLHRMGPLYTAAYVLSPAARLVVPTASGRRASLATTAVTILGRAEGRAGRCLGRSPQRLDVTSLRK